MPSYETPSGEYLTLSQSLNDLIFSSESECCKIIRHILTRLENIEASSYRTLCHDTCTCSYCRHVRKNKRPTRLLNKDLPGNFFSFREAQGMISFMPKGRRQEKNEDGGWKREGRQEMKPARWIKAMINPRLAKRMKDHVFSKFDTVLKAEEKKHEVRFEEVDFEDAYDQDNFDDGHTPDSCMFGKPVGPFYRKFGAKAIVAVGSGGLYKGRAILWPKVFVEGQEETISFLDRIYYRDKEVLELFMKYARSEGWHHKSRQSKDYQRQVTTPSNDNRLFNMWVEANEDISRTRFFPYLDTFCFGEDDESLQNHGEGKYSYWQTDGKRHEHSIVTDVDGNWIRRDGALYVQGNYYPRGDSRVVTCSRSGYPILARDAVRVNYSSDTFMILHRRYIENLGSQDSPPTSLEQSQDEALLEALRL